MLRDMFRGFPQGSWHDPIKIETFNTLASEVNLKLLSALYFKSIGLDLF